MNVTEAVIGKVLPILMGTRRVSQSLIWYNDFTAIPHTTQTSSGGGGKGLGGGGGSTQTTTTYTYTAATMGALCSGPVSGIVDVWDTKGRYQQTSVSESFTIPGGGGSYTVNNHALFKVDMGVGVTTAYSQSVNDFGSSGSVTLSGTYQVPMTVGAGVGQYTVNALTGQYTLHAADAGKNVQITYSYNLLTILNTENASVPGTPFQILVQDSADFLQDLGVTYYPSGTALVKVGSSPTVGQYTVSAGLYTFAAADSGQGVQIQYATNTSNQNSDAQTALNLTLLPGAKSQAVWSYLNSRHPEAAFGYTETAIVASQAMDLGENGEMPNYSLEIAGPYIFGSGTQDCDPADCIGALLADPSFGIGFNTAFFGDWTAASNFWVANSFFISPLLTSQDTVASTIGSILEAGMTAAFCSEGQLKLVPYGDTSAAGNGQIFVPNTQPVVDLNDDDFIGDGLVKVQRSAWQDAYNKVQVQWTNRLNAYNSETTTEQDDAAIQRYGLRTEDPQSWDFICTLAAAQFAANLRVKRNVNIRAQYTFSLSSRYSYLEPMDLITITVPELGWTQLPVRIQKIVDNPDENGLEITAEEFPWGTAQPTKYQKQLGAGFQPTAGQADPGNTTALIFESPNRLSKQESNILYGFVNGASPAWGGTQPFVSFDGVNYQPYGPPITAPARLGTLNTSLAAGVADPDTNNFSVTMTSAGSVLPSLSTSDFNQGTNLCVLVDTTDNNPFELFSYKNATLIGPNQYKLDTFHRGLMQTTNAAHSPGETFAVLDQASFTYQYDSTYYGQTIFFKFPSFNTVGGRPQPLSQASVYSFVLNGVGPGAIDVNTGIYRPGQGSIPNSWAGSISFSSSNPGTSLTLTWSLTLTRGTMPNPNQPGNTLTSQVYIGSQIVTGLTASTLYSVYPYVDDTQAGSPLVFVLNSQVAGAVGTPAICFTSPTANATFFQGRNDHIPLAAAPFQVSTAATSGGGGTGGSSPPIEGTCPRGDMLVRHKDKGVIPVCDLVLGDFIAYRDEWVRVIDLNHKMRNLWIEVVFGCGEKIVVTPNHLWTSLEGEKPTEFLKEGEVMADGNIVTGLRTITGDALCVHITVDHADHSYNIGSENPIVITHNGGRISIS